MSDYTPTTFNEFVMDSLDETSPEKARKHKADVVKWSQTASGDTIDKKFETRYKGFKQAGKIVDADRKKDR